MKLKFTLLSLLFLMTGCAKEFGPLFEKAEIAFAERNHIVAIDSLNAAIPLWKDSDGQEKRGRAYEMLGISYHKLRKRDKAVEALDQAVKLSDKTYEAAYQLGQIYFTSSQFKLAARTYKKALRAKPNDPLSLLGLGNVYFELRQYENAILNYKRIINTSPGVSEALEHIRLARSKMKKKKKARTYRRR